MSDFLTRLINRSRGNYPMDRQIEPLTAPLFAAGAEIGAPYGESHDVMAASIDEDPDSAGRSDYPSSVSHDQTTDPSRTMSVQRQLEKRSISISSQNSETEGEPETLASKAGESMSQLDQASNINPISTPITSKSPTQPVEGASPVIIRPELKITAANRASIANWEAMEPGAQPRSSDSSSNAKAGEFADGGGSGASVIRVTIGRIDVRATPSTSGGATQSRRESPAAPKLSLEEYLRSRSGRKR